jgi:hypothetical protein
MTIGLRLGAPGIYRLTDEPLRALTGERMDVCAFVGVAPRGPARLPAFVLPWAVPANGDPVPRRSVPVAVESWQAYQRIFGGFEGPGLLPYAVSAFFANGGQRAHVVRIVHGYRQADGVSPDEPRNAAGTATALLDGLKTTDGRPVRLTARDEGPWGNALSVRLVLQARPLAIASVDILPDRLRLARGAGLADGALLRLNLADADKVLRRVASQTREWNPVTGERETWIRFDSPTAIAAAAVELVEASLSVDDGAGRRETLVGIGLQSAHPRWLARVLIEESSLLWPGLAPDLDPDDPASGWLAADLAIDPALPVYASTVFEGGQGRYADLVAGDFFDPDWVPGDGFPGDGVHALVDIDELAMLVVPDLYSPGPLAPIEAIVDAGGFAGAGFAECVTPPKPAEQAAPPDDLTGLRLDPATDLDAITALQRRLIDLADQLRSPIVLLDVPPGLSQRRMLAWRGNFDSAFAAAYHPWLKMVPDDDPRRQLIAVNPSAAAAGIVAQRERQFGVAFGPANVVAAGVVAVADPVTSARHDELHQSSINVFVAERGGVRLSAARTLSLDRDWRQLNVRRLVTMVARVLQRQMQWAVFEPNDQRLRALLARMLEAYLRQLYRANAFTGATEAQAFFVRCDDGLNPPALADSGQLLAQIGIAPAEPMEFIVLNLSRSADSSLSVEA